MGGLLRLLKAMRDTLSSIIPGRKSDSSSKTISATVSLPAVTEAPANPPSQTQTLSTTPTPGTKDIPLSGDKASQLSEMAIQMLKRFEGFSLVSYQDVVGIWTIGWGHTPSNPNCTITQEVAERLLRSDAELACKQVLSVVSVPLNQNQLDALISFTFNLGIGNLKESTLLSKLNSGTVPKEEVAVEFLRWVKAGGKIVTGLVNRRAEEHDLFLKEV